MDACKYAHAYTLAQDGRLAGLFKYQDDENDENNQEKYKEK